MKIIREPENAVNPNNILILTVKGKVLGNMPANLCIAVAPLYDSGKLFFDRAEVSYVEPISKRSRHAKQAVLFLEIALHL